MTKKIFRNYLEIKSLKDLNEIKKPSERLNLSINNPKDFQLNKFFYKNVGKKYRWVDRLSWSEKNWIDYISDKKLTTFVLKEEKNIVGYFELLFYKSKEEAEIVYFGILEEYFGKKLGGYLLSEAIKQSFIFGSKRTWVHTCSMDHKHALKNYISRGMKVFKSEVLINF